MGAASGGVRRTAAGTSQQWPAVEMGPEGEEGAIPAFLSERERRIFKQLCNGIGIRQEAYRRLLCWRKDRMLGALWFSTGRHIVPPHCRWGPFSAHLRDGVRSGAAYHPASAALESGRPCRVLHQRWMRVMALLCCAGCASWASGKQNPGSAKRRVPVRFRV